MKKIILAALAALILGFTVTATLAAGAASATEQTVEVAWLLPNGGTATNVTWPQSDVPIPECGIGTWQVDTYTVEDAAELRADGILTKGEDYGKVISWHFVTPPPCPQPPDEAWTELYHQDVTCVSPTTWQVVSWLQAYTAAYELDAAGQWIVGPPSPNGAPTTTVLLSDQYAPGWPDCSLPEPPAVVRVTDFTVTQPAGELG